jgi:uncharacterized protein YjiS (DUF1127 family)
MSISSAEEDHAMTMFSAFRRWLDYRRTTNELALFNDRNLADIGLVRFDVMQVEAVRGMR